MDTETNEKHPVDQIAEACGGTITAGGILPDGSGFAVMSMPLRKDHWIYGDGSFNVPPMPFRMGSGWRSSVLIQSPESVKLLGLAQRTLMSKDEFADRVRDAGRYAVKCATMNGTDMDFDPDAMIQNLVVGMLGYWSDDGLSAGDDWANPQGGGGDNWKSPSGREVSSLPENLPAPTAAVPDFGE